MKSGPPASQRTNDAISLRLGAGGGCDGVGGGDFGSGGGCGDDNGDRYGGGFGGGGDDRYGGGDGGGGGDLCSRGFPVRISAGTLAAVN